MVKNVLVALIAFVTVLTHPVHAKEQQHPRLPPEDRPPSVHTAPPIPTPTGDLHRALEWQWRTVIADNNAHGAWYAGLVSIAETNTRVWNERAKAALIPKQNTQQTVPSSHPSGSIADVMQCIKNHESGNYNESSHPGAGSGAFQFTPGTWQTWSAKAGYGGYAYAYLAPADVQDAVTAYTLTHGGAGNWSPRYGDDPCTVGMGG